MTNKKQLLQELYELLDENNNLMEIPSEELLSRAFVYINGRFRRECFDEATEVADLLSTIIKKLIEKNKLLMIPTNNSISLKPLCEKEHPEYVRTYTKEWTLDDKGREVYPKICDKCNVIWYD